MYKAVVAELQKIPEIRRVPLHNRPLHHADQSICTRQRTLDGPTEQQNARDTGSNRHRDPDFSGAKHQERNSYSRR